MNSIEASTRPRLSPVKLRYYRNYFSDGLRLSVEGGSLLLLRWQIYREETKLHPYDMSELLPLARAIVSRWSKIEDEYGKDCLLVDRHETFDFNPATFGIFLGPTNPKTLENSWKLRMLKGEEWWEREHQLETLAGMVQSETSPSDDPQVHQLSERIAG